MFPFARIRKKTMKILATLWICLKRTKAEKIAQKNVHRNYSNRLNWMSNEKTGILHWIWRFSLSWTRWIRFENRFSVKNIGLNGKSCVRHVLNWKIRCDQESKTGEIRTKLFEKVWSASEWKNCSKRNRNRQKCSVGSMKYFCFRIERFCCEIWKVFA